MVLIWFWYYFGMVLVCFWYGVGIVLVWFWYGFDTVCYGSGMVMVSFLNRGFRIEGLVPESGFRIDRLPVPDTGPAGWKIQYRSIGVEPSSIETE